MLADAHIHLFTHEDLARYEGVRTAADIDVALVVGYEGLPTHRGNNDLVLQLVQGRTHLVPLAYVPTATPDPARIAALIAQGFDGITLYATDEDAAEQLAGWPAAAVQAVSARCPIVSVNVRAPFADRIAHILAGFEPATVLISHLGLPGRYSQPPTPAATRERLAGVLDLAAHQNVGVKLSAFYATCEPRDRHPPEPARPFVDALVDRFGPARCFWGSDFPPALNFTSLERAIEAYLPSAVDTDERASIMGGNLRALLAGRAKRAAG